MCRVNRWPVLFLFILAVTCLAGCADKAATAPTAPTAMASPSAAQTSDGCYTVQFQGTSNDGMTIVLTGELEGTVVAWFPGAPRNTGVMQHNTSIGVMTITGGVAGPLTFETVADFRNHVSDRPGSPWNVFEYTGTIRATGGVERANLNVKGTTTLTLDEDGNVVGVFLDQRYWGVICP